MSFTKTAYCVPLGRSRSRFASTSGTPSPSKGLTGRRPDAECPAAASLEEVRKILSKVSESLADAVAADREER